MVSLYGLKALGFRVPGELSAVFMGWSSIIVGASWLSR